MHVTSNAEEDFAIGLSASLPRVTSVRAAPEYRLSVTFDDGLSGVVDCYRMVFGEAAGVFARLRNKAEFDAAFVQHGAVTWPGELDLAPDAMYMAIAAHGQWLLT